MIHNNCFQTKHMATYVVEARKTVSRDFSFEHPNYKGYVACRSAFFFKTLLSGQVLSDFINLTQVHNFTVSGQDIFTFRRLSIFTVSFTRILQVLMQIMKRFALTSQVVVVHSLQPKGPESESTYFFFF